MLTFSIILNAYLWLFMSIYSYLFVLDEINKTWLRITISLLIPPILPFFVFLIILFFLILYATGNLKDDDSTNLL